MSRHTNARDAILARIREANATRDTFDHPGGFEGWRPAVEPEDRTAAFVRRFENVGGEAVRVAGRDAAHGWIRTFTSHFESAAYGVGVAAATSSLLPTAPPEDADLAISMARGAIAETGSLIMDARDGRRTQLLCPTHLVLLDAATIHATARSAFADLSTDLPSAIGLHSGPSKSADIGQIMVKGVHGPARVVALIIEHD